jgi:hypothetical protein
VNRFAEMAALHDAWERATAGAPEMVVVVREAGVGKTRLIAEFAAAARPATVLYGRGERAGHAGRAGYCRPAPYVDASSISPPLRRWPI